MHIKFKGKFKNDKQMNDAVIEVVQKIVTQTGISPDKIQLEDVKMNVVFTIEGEQRYLTVPRTVQGIESDEIFMVEVELDEEGNIAKQRDNEEKSFFDDYTLASALGVDYQVEEIESQYKDEDLELIETMGSEDGAMGRSYKIISEPGKILNRYYKSNKLAAEEVLEERG